MSDLDQFDLAILRILQVDNRLTTDTIGERVGLSATACQRRIKRLRDSGVIAAEAALLDPERVGGLMTMIVQVTLARGGPHAIDAFKREVQDIPEIQQCYYVTGDYDFVLVVTVADIAAYERLTRQVFFANPRIDRFHAFVVMDRVKAGLQIPL